MYLSIVLPIVDLRPLLGIGMLPKPSWGELDDQRKEFVHSFGGVRRRGNGPRQTWTEDPFYVSAKRAIRFDDSFQREHPLGPLRPAQVGFRGLSRDKSGVAVRVEMGVAAGLGQAGALDGHACLRVIKRFLDLPSYVARARQRAGADGDPGRRPPGPLQLAGDALAKLYLMGTTKASAPVDPHAVRAGEPLVFVVHEPGEIAELPQETQMIDPAKVGGAAIGYRWFENHGRSLGVWFVDGASAPGPLLRNLRIGLGTLHARRKALLEVVGAYRRGALAPSATLAGFLQDCLALFDAEFKYGFNQRATLDVTAAHDALPPAELEQALRDVKESAEIFDVFLCHNSKDKAAVEEIAQRLESRRIRPWLDKQQLPPGQPYAPLLKQQIRSTRSAAVFVGSAGIGPWQDKEIHDLLQELDARRCPVIPVLLPGAPDQPELPEFLQGVMWVDFRQPDADPLERLIWGITSKRPPALSRATSSAGQGSAPT